MPVFGDLKKSVLHLKLHSPETANSFGLAEARDLTRALKSARESARAVVLTAAPGPWFCSGGNLAAYAAQKTRQSGIKDNAEIRAALTLLRNFPAPVLAVVAGDCYGGGMELIGAATERWATPRAHFGFWQRRISLSFGWGGFSPWQERVGRASLLREALAARSISASEAAGLGFVDRILPEELVSFHIEKWASRAVSLPLAPVAKLKQMTPSNADRLFNLLWWNPEHREMLKKFRTRRS